MPDVPDSIYLLIARSTCYGTSDSAHQFRIYDSWHGAEVLSAYDKKAEAEADMERLVESHNHELFGPPKQVLAIAEVEMK